VRFEPKVREVVAGVLTGAVTLGALVAAITRNVFSVRPLVGEGYPIERIGEALLSDYLVPFEIASVLLLVVMIGAAYLAKGRRS
jgi:NADH-quinone oxidoreductase subunit J